jgi:transmembrane sensor
MDDPRMELMLRAVAGDASAEERIRLQAALEAAPTSAAALFAAAEFEQDLRALFTAVVAEPAEPPVRPLALRRQARAAWVRPLIAAAAVMTVAVGGFWAYRTFSAAPSAARLVDVEGDVGIVTAAGETPARIGAELPDAAGLRLGRAGRAVAVFADGSRVVFHEGVQVSTVTVERRGSGGTSIVLLRGRLTAEVAARSGDRPFGITTPSAKVTVIGTRFELSSDDGATRVEVGEGVVELARTSDGASARVSAGEFAVAAPGVPLAAQPIKAAAGAGSGRFTDITRESGLEAAVAAHYAAHPKWWISGLTFADLGAAGHLDLHLGSHGGGPALALKNAGDLKFAAVDPTPAKRGVREKADLPYPGGELRVVYDFDDDGKLDVVAAYGDGQGASYRNAGGWNHRRDGFLDQFSRSFALTDLNRDGIVDYIQNASEGRDPNPRIRVMLGKPGGGFLPPATINGGLAEAAAIPVDINADGHIDLLVSQNGYHPAARRILLNDGRGNFADATRPLGLDPDGGSIHGVGDFNRDGRPDLVCIENAKIEIHLCGADGKFVRKPGAVTGLEQAGARVAGGSTGTNWGGAVCVDFDNDGIPDLIINGKSFCYLLRGNGDGGFVYVNKLWGLTDSAWSAVGEGLCFGDLDGDGRLDLAMCSRDDRNKSVRLFRNELPPQHWVRIRPAGKPGNRAALGAKIRLYEPGGLNDPARLIACEQIALWGRQSFHSYYSAAVTERHFGLGSRQTVDVSVEFAGGRRVERRAVPADTTVSIREE